MHRMPVTMVACPCHVRARCHCIAASNFATCVHARATMHVCVRPVGLSIGPPASQTASQTAQKAICLLSVARYCLLTHKWTMADYRARLYREQRCRRCRRAPCRRGEVRGRAGHSGCWAPGSCLRVAVCRRVHGHAHGPVHGRLYRHVCGHVYRGERRYVTGSCLRL